MRVRVIVAIVALAVLAGASATTHRAGASPEITGYPDSIAGLGDSITRAVNSDAFGDRPENSWVTGTNASVDTIYSRLLAVHPAISGNRFNEAVSGARMTDLNGQAQDAVAAGAELVTVFMGANDVCTSSEASMTSVATFQAQFETAIATLASGLPDARIAVLSIPDIHNLWAIHKDNATARFIWAFASICQSMLADPLSTDPADVQRRANVRQRNIDFNDVLNSVCAEYVHCKFDGYIGFNTVFTPAHVSTIDYFHPSVAGQALIAQLAWDTAFDWTDATPPVSDSTGGEIAGGASVTLSAIDNDAVSGIEYHTGGAWAKYDAPLSLATGTVVTWRAVDVNGNSEATHTCRIGGWSWPSGDADCDGFTSADEGSIGTDSSVACDDGLGLPDWPPDFDNNRTINIVDVLALKPVFGLPSSRHDLDASGGPVNIVDVLALKPVFGQSCTS
ncbi:MAG: hypothetical protein IIA90_07045 [Chloroflexi bacterium]|nr:hypothetical protein [Chloroflexota bacterium]